MKASGSKKVLILCILEILKRYSSEETRLSQTDIIRLIKEEYNLNCERKAVKRNIEFLIEFGYDIATPSESKHGYYLRGREFDESELRLLVDSVLAFRYIPERYASDLIEKLIKLAPIEFINRTRHIFKTEEWSRSENKDIFLNIDLIDEAIERNRKISFIYNEYDIDKKLKPRREERYLVNPYQMILHNQRYYLILNVDKYDNISCYRIDYITDIEITDQPIKKLTTLDGCENGLELGRISTQHPYLYFTTEIEKIVLKSNRNLIGDLLDWFGSDIDIKDVGKGQIEVTLYASIQAMRYWALQYGMNVEVLAPQSLRNMIRSDLRVMCDKYF